MTRDELRSHALTTLGYSERMTQDLLDAYDLGCQSEREACAKVCDESCIGDYGDMDKARIQCANKILARSNVELTGSRAGSSPVSPATEGSEVERRIGPREET